MYIHTEISRTKSPRSFPNDPRDDEHIKQNICWDHLLVIRTDQRFGVILGILTKTIDPPKNIGWTMFFLLGGFDELHNFLFISHPKTTVFPQKTWADSAAGSGICEVVKYHHLVEVHLMDNFANCSIRLTWLCIWYVYIYIYMRIYHLDFGWYNPGNFV